jgi:hypothetical protein
MAGEHGQITSIMRQEGDRVLVSLPLVGFPPGYTLRPGSRVVVVFDENGPAVRPAVEPVPVGNSAPQISANSLTASGRSFDVPANIVRDDSGSGDYVAFVIGGGDDGEQVVALRRQPQ